MMEIQAYSSSRLNFTPPSDSRLESGIPIAQGKKRKSRSNGVERCLWEKYNSAQKT